MTWIRNHEPKLTLLAQPVRRRLVSIIPAWRRACAGNPLRQPHLRQVAPWRDAVGYRCKSCVKSQQAAFYTATSADYIVAALITLPLAAIGQFIGPLLGFFALFVGPMVGGLCAELVYRANGKRGANIPGWSSAACMSSAHWRRCLFSALPVLGWLAGSVNARALAGLLWPLIYLALAAGSAIARLEIWKVTCCLTRTDLSDLAILTNCACNWPRFLTC